MENKFNEILEDLTPDERAEAIKILNEMSDCDGHSELLQALYEEDYEEIPVDIDTFIENDEYCGKTTDNGNLIYPYWRDRLRELFNDPNKYQEVAITGSIGTGKSTVACYGMAYLLYRVMCLKDPQKYFRLAAGSTIVFAFFNNTLDLSSSVGYGTVQNIIQNSPWFMERGTISGSKNLEYVPNKLIRFRVGSTASHALGTNILCLTGDTVICTENGNYAISELEGKETVVFSLDNNGNIIKSDKCHIIQNGVTSELYEITLENNSIIKCTAEHKFMLKDGTYKKAKDLTEFDELYEVQLN